MSTVQPFLAPSDDGICIVEVWESQEAFESNAQQLGSLVGEEIGIPGTLVIEFFEIHNYLPGWPARR